MLYNNLSGYFREKYGKRLKKICIDGGFTCPNRDGRCGTGGCIFCGERGSGEHINPRESIGAQVSAALARANADDLFVAYFQNFTNTYAPPRVLRERYDAALIDERIKVLAIGTRADCIDEEVCSLIAKYKSSCEVWVELGLQTASDATAKIINRGYSRAVFEEAVRLLNKYEIPVCVHLIIGLPGEDANAVRESADYISGLDIWGVKIHSLYVIEGTRLADMYRAREYYPPDFKEYIERAACVLSRIPPNVIVHRLTGDPPTGLFLAPEWSRDKHRVIDGIVAYMEERSLRQGCLYKRR